MRVAVPVPCNGAGALLFAAVFAHACARAHRCAKCRCLCPCLHRGPCAARALCHARARGCVVAPPPKPPPLSSGELCPIIDRIGGDRLPLDDPAVVDLLEGRSLDWRGTKWKELAVLEWFSGYVPVALGLHRKPKKATLAQVLGWLADLYALRLEVTEEWSLALANTRAILVAVLKLCIKASVTIPRPGYASVAELKATDRELRRINKKVSL